MPNYATLKQEYSKPLLRDAIISSLFALILTATGSYFFYLIATNLAPKGEILLIVLSFFISFLLLGLAGLLFYAVWRFYKDSKELQAEILRGTFVRMRSMKGGYLYILSTEDTQVEKGINVPTHWMDRLKQLPLKVELWRGKNSQKLLRIVIIDTGEVLDVLK